MKAAEFNTLFEEEWCFRKPYLAGDVRGHGWRRLWQRVGVLGHEARVVGGDAAEPVGPRRGHLEEAVWAERHRSQGKKKKNNTQTQQDSLVFIRI